MRGSDVHRSAEVDGAVEIRRHVPRKPCDADIDPWNNGPDPTTGYAG